MWLLSSDLRSGVDHANLEPRMKRKILGAVYGFTLIEMHNRLPLTYNNLINHFEWCQIKPGFLWSGIVSSPVGTQLKGHRGVR